LVFIDSGRTMEIILATTKKGETTIADPVVDAVIKTIKENQIDVLIIDPFVSSHRVTENDNNAIEAVVKKGLTSRRRRAAPSTGTSPQDGRRRGDGRGRTRGLRPPGGGPVCAVGQHHDEG
jgi:AAA domain